MLTFLKKNYINLCILQPKKNVLEQQNYFWMEKQHCVGLSSSSVFYLCSQEVFITLFCF